MPRYVDADKLTVEDIRNLDQLPGEDVAPVIHAQWIADPDNPFGDLCMCSNCKGKVFDMDADRVSFCPYCGAKMQHQKPDPLVGYLYWGEDGIARCSCCNKSLRYLVRPFEEMQMCPYCGVKLEPRKEQKDTDGEIH